MKLVYGCNEPVTHFVASLIPRCRERGFPDGSTAIGVAKDDRLVGGFVFSNWSPEAGTIEISFAGMDRRWLSRAILYAAFSYVFDQLGCQMAISQTPAGLTHAVRICKAYGFKQVTVPRLFGRDEDGIVSTLTAEDWRANGFHLENSP
ncbi:MAG: GNAT family N-acetyltransferase [Parvibaculaceae bacterium]